jgi:DNA-binding helix-hairpin-helix protein with protein kinase domain
MELQTEDGKVVRLSRELTRPGGEGQVFEVLNSPASVAKVYHRPPDHIKIAKLRYQAQLAKPELRSIAAWPTNVLLERNGTATVRGILMPRMTGKEIHKLYGPADRGAEFPKAGWDFLIHVAMNCAAAFETLHENGVLMADVNEGNLLVNERTGQVGLIDCDSYQIPNGNGSYLCDVGIPMYTPPELQGIDFRGMHRTPNHDRFGLAVIIFRLLFMGRHPFAGIPKGREQFEIAEAIGKFLFAFAPQTWVRGVAQPPHSLSLGALPDRLGKLFERAFLQPTGVIQRPSGREWVVELKALLSSLKKGCLDQSHKYWGGLAACPWCEIVVGGGPNFFISVSITGASGNLEAELMNLWAIVEKVVRGALMQEQVAIPGIGQPTPTPVGVAKPVPPNMAPPVAPVRSVPPARQEIPEPLLPTPPEMGSLAPAQRIPLGPNEGIPRLCTLGAVFFGLFSLFCYQLDELVSAIGSFLAFVATSFFAINKSGEAQAERKARIQAEQEALEEEERLLQEDYSMRLVDYERQVEDARKLHLANVAHVEAEFQNEWLLWDQAYQTEYNQYLNERRKYDVQANAFEVQRKKWDDEVARRRHNEARLRQQLLTLVEQKRSLLEAFQNKVNSSFPALEAARKRFDKAKLDEAGDLQHLAVRAREIQLQQFLSGKMLQNAAISLIGDVKTATLSAYGFNTAADINDNMVVPGFGEVLVGKLVAWRQSCESQFRYNPKTPLPAAELNKVKIKHAQTQQSALAELRAGATKLDSLENQTRLEISNGRLEILQLARLHVQAKADLDLCS